MSRQSEQIPYNIYRYYNEGDPAWIIATEVDPIIQQLARDYGEVKRVAGPFNSKKAAEQARLNLQSTAILREELEGPKGG